MGTKGYLQRRLDMKSLASWLVPPARGWYRKSGGMLRSRLFLPLVGLSTVILALALSSYLLLPPDLHPLAYLLHASLLLTALALISTVLIRAQQDYHIPLTYLRNWALRVRAGHLGSRIPVPAQGEFCELANDINSLSQTLQNLSDDMQNQVRKQTRRIEQKTHSLEILYDVAASINASRDLEDLLTRFLHTLKDVVDARAAAVRLITDDGEMRLVASIGLDQDIVEKEQLVPSKHCLCGSAMTLGVVQCHNDLRQCGHTLGRPFFESNNVAMLAVPLEHRDTVFGVYNLFVDDQTIAAREDIKNLLISIGRHLGMAIAKARLDEETHRLSITEERTQFAHELHDSLAQSLASLRFQVRVLDESMHQGDEAIIWQELEKVENTLSNANSELRELISHFRLPLDSRGLVPAVEDLVKHFREEANINTYLQVEWSEERLPPKTEIQVLRIIQEALCNIRKHSQAQNVRIRLRDHHDHTYTVLVEDDGNGLATAVRKAGPGEHVGLGIMQERAKGLGGELSIESDPDEGTRILLSFTYPAPHSPYQTIIERMDTKQAVS